MNRFIQILAATAVLFTSARAASLVYRDVTVTLYPPHQSPIRFDDVYFATVDTPDPDCIEKRDGIEFRTKSDLSVQFYGSFRVTSATEPTVPFRSVEAWSTAKAPVASAEGANKLSEILDQLKETDAPRANASTSRARMHTIFWLLISALLGASGALLIRERFRPFRDAGN